MADRELTIKIKADGKQAQTEVADTGRDFSVFAKGVEVDAGRLSRLSLAAPVWKGLSKTESAFAASGARIVKTAGDTGKAAGDALGQGVGSGSSTVAKSVSDINRQWRAGLLSIAQYRAALVEAAETAEKGSKEQLAAYTSMQAARRTYAGMVKASAREEAAAVAQAAREEADSVKKAEADKQNAIKRTENQRRSFHLAAGSVSAVGNNLTAVATAPLLLFAKKAVSVASDVAEAEDKVNRIFVDQAQTIKDWAKTTSSSLGISELETLKYAGTYGNLLRSMGATPDEAAKVSTSLIKTAVDMAALSNTPLPQALNAITSGLQGQAKPLRTYGVSLSVARIQQEALSTGIVKSVVATDRENAALFRVADARVKLRVAVQKHGDASYEASKAQNELRNAEAALAKVQEGHAPKLTAYQKALATISIVNKDAKLSTDNFKNTSGQLAGQLKIAEASATDLAAEFGKDLLPMTKDIVHQAVLLMDALKNLSPEQKEQIVKWLALTAAAGPALKLLAGGANVIMGLGKAMAFARDLELSGNLLKAGASAATAAGEVTALSTALLGLQALGVVAVTVAVAYLANRYVGQPLADAMGRDADALQDRQYGNSTKSDASLALAYIKKSTDEGRLAYAGDGNRQSAIGQQISNAIAKPFQTWLAKNPNASQDDQQKYIVGTLLPKLAKVYQSQIDLKPNQALIKSEHEAADRRTDAEINRRIQAAAKAAPVNQKQDKPAPTPTVPNIPMPTDKGPKTVDTTAEQRASYREGKLGTTFQDALTAYGQSAPFGEKERAGFLGKHTSFWREPTVFQIVGYWHPQILLEPP